jgi:hypothetical protein
VDVPTPRLSQESIATPDRTSAGSTPFGKRSLGVAPLPGTQTAAGCRPPPRGRYSVPAKEARTQLKRTRISRWSEKTATLPKVTGGRAHRALAGSGAPLVPGAVTPSAATTATTDAEARLDDTTTRISDLQELSIVVAGHRRVNRHADARLGGTRERLRSAVRYGFRPRAASDALPDLTPADTVILDGQGRARPLRELRDARSTPSQISTRSTRRHVSAPASPRSGTTTATSSTSASPLATSRVTGCTGDGRVTSEGVAAAISSACGRSACVSVVCNRGASFPADTRRGLLDGWRAERRDRQAGVCRVLGW